MSAPEAESSTRTALIAGATGLIGGHLLERLLREPRYRQVIAVGRRAPDVSHDKLIVFFANFDKLEPLPEPFKADDVYCCLGTTIKKAGSKEAFRAVDQDYVARLADLGRDAGAERFLLVSSVDASPASSNFYLEVKGSAEKAVESFGYPEIHIFRPSVLKGSRKDFRPAERIGSFFAGLISPILSGSLKRYRPIQARTVAHAMIAAALAGDEGRHVYTFEDITRLGT